MQSRGWFLDKYLKKILATNAAAHIIQSSTAYIPIDII